MAIEAVGPRGPQAKVPGAFVWRTDAPPPYTVVVADGAYRELFRLEGVEACAATPPEALRAALAAGGAFSWQVFARAGGRAVVSPTEAFEIR